LLWDQLSEAVECFWTDMEEQGTADDTVMWIFSEFGRRVADNGTGTDHGSGGSAFLIGPSVKGGLYGDYPNLDPGAQLDGDVRFNTDYRDVYATILESFMELDSEAILNKQFGRLDLAAV
jgi:uncharacterized protein (DUF1501 family)